MFRTPVSAATLLVLAALMPVHAATQTLNFTKTISFDGVTVTVFASLTVDTTARTLVGTATVTVVNSTTGETILSKTFNISLSFGASESVRFLLSLPTVPLSLAVDCEANVGSTPSAVCMVSRTPDMNRSGTVDAFDLSMLLAHYGALAGSSSYSSAADLNANGKVDFFDLATLLAYYHAQVLA